jgi:hypothetical protein
VVVDGDGAAVVVGMEQLWSSSSATAQLWLAVMMIAVAVMMDTARVIPDDGQCLTGARGHHYIRVT